MTEQEVINLIKAKKLRVVCAKRKRKLRKRGISVRWMADLGAYVWEPNFGNLTRN